MKGLLKHAPTEPELERLYYELARAGASSVGRKQPWPYAPRGFEELFALACEMLRFDPRLLSILLQLVLQRWFDLNPVTLRRDMRAMAWPQALLVVAEFAKAATIDPELRYWADHLCAGWPRVDPAELFFFDMERPGTKTAARRLGRNIAAYARWGFVGSEKPIVDAVTKRTVGRYDVRTREQILASLVERSADFTLNDYLAAVDHSIGRQQALADLKRSPLIVMHGKGRGARWRRRAALDRPRGRARAAR
jgi:hypothetical protein